MSNLTTQQRYAVPGGTLKVVLTTYHTLTTVEREELDRIGVACVRFQELRRAAHRDPAVAGGDPAGDVDEAIWELGGEQEIMAG
jgi:hypothetical protein